MKPEQVGRSGVRRTCIGLTVWEMSKWRQKLRIGAKLDGHQGILAAKFLEPSHHRFVGAALGKAMAATGLGDAIFDGVHATRWQPRMRFTLSQVNSVELIAGGRQSFGNTFTQP